MTELAEEQRTTTFADLGLDEDVLHAMFGEIDLDGDGNIE